MKNVVKLFSIGVMTVLLSFNASLSFSQSKGKTIKKGAYYIGNVERPRQVAAYGTPAWLFNTVIIAFDGDICGMAFPKTFYSINMYTGGVGEFIYQQSSESFHATYCVKNECIYLWDLEMEEPKVESDYSLILKIEDGYLMVIESQIQWLDKVKLIYMGNHHEEKKLSDEQQQQIEIDVFNKLLRN